MQLKKSKKSIGITFIISILVSSPLYSYGQYLYKGLSASTSNMEEKFYKGIEYVEKGDYVTAEKYLVQSAEMGDFTSQAMLGSMFGRGHVVPFNFYKAKKYLSLAVKNNDLSYSDKKEVPMLENILGEIHVIAPENYKDYKEAYKWFVIAANKNNMAAQSNLGVLYHQGLGVDRSEEKAIKWLSKTAQQGDHGAKEYLQNIRR
jgi:TPR repeat protein